jgi:hypothetical protein
VKDLDPSQPEQVVKKTLAATTQLVDSVEAETRTTPRWHFKSTLPSLRPWRPQEGFHTDTFFADTKTQTGFKCAQVFVGAMKGLTYVVPMKGKGYAPDALKAFIQDIGAPAFLLTDNAYEEVRAECEEICKTYCILLVSSEPDYQHQNKAERRIQDNQAEGSTLDEDQESSKEVLGLCCAVSYGTHQPHCNKEIGLENTL